MVKLKSEPVIPKLTEDVAVAVAPLLSVTFTDNTFNPTKDGVNVALLLKGEEEKLEYSEFETELDELAFDQRYA